MKITTGLFCLLGLTFLSPHILAQDKSHLSYNSEFGSFVEEGFPFFCQTVDARAFGDHPAATNLTPRGIVVKFGDGCFGCFDPDLLRWSLLWKANDDGEYLTMDGMAPGSYRLPERKSEPGQNNLPKPIGTPVSWSPAVPGWWSGDNPPEGDPRDRGKADEGEVGLGPLPAKAARFEGIGLITGGLRLSYTVGSTEISEYIVADATQPTHVIQIAPHTENLWRRSIGQGKTVWTLIEPSSTQSTIVIQGHKPDSDASLPGRLWSAPVTVVLKKSDSETKPFISDDLGIPVPNPWKRNVRLAGLDFFPDGRAVFTTFDGDIWLVDGLHEGSAEASWHRFASGLHEPQAVCIVNSEIYVSDRNGIVRLKDTDGNGEADWYENFSNIVPQTAETREFAMDMVAAREGGFYIAKGGQVGSTRGIANSAVIKISPDGRSYEVIAHGLRQPYLGYDPETGILTASDQQGNWKPATPIYRIEPGKYFGFQPAKFKDKAIHPAPIDPPEIWIPHFIHQSAGSQVWMNSGARMGSLNNSLIHLGYNRPELFKIYLSENRTQGAVVPVLSGFPSALLKGRIHPLDGRLYVCGFKIYVAASVRISGLYRVRPTAKPSWIPSAIEATRRGVLLTFDRELSPDLVGDVARYSIDRWNYRQTHNYGSGNYKLNGEPGQESVAVASSQLSKDRKSLFIALPDIRPCHSMRVTYRLPVTELDHLDSAYLTIRSLEKIDLTSRGFASDQIDMTPRATAVAAVKVKPTSKLGRETALRFGCIACHATGEAGLPAPPALDNAQVVVGPPWIGLWKSRRDLTDGSYVERADEAYLRESILDPTRRVAAGFEIEKSGVGMPSYLGVLKDHELDSIILYIKTLAKKGR